MADTDESSASDDDAPVDGSLSLSGHLRRLAQASGGGSDDEDEEAADATLATSTQPASEQPTREPAAHTNNTSLPPLPSADEVLVGDGRHSHGAFLKSDALQPEFDSSKTFRPPPPSHADLMSVQSAEPGAHACSDEAEEDTTHQRWPRESDTRSGRGSICIETDDERGRRVKYGAHQMLAADPWSDCNPNMPMRRGGPAAGKRKR